MSELKWIDELSAAELKAELEKRALRLEGTETIMRARLARHERYQTLGLDPTHSPTYSELEFLAPLETGAMRPDSPSERIDVGAGLRGTLHPGGTDRATARRPGSPTIAPFRAQPRFTPPLLPLSGGDRRVAPSGNGRPSNRGTTSVMDVYNIMRRWNLNFTGARGSDAEAFLMRIEEGRTLLPVSDEDLLKTLPFFLTGTALYWFRHKRTEVHSWQEFVVAWRAWFGNPDFQFALRDEAARRTQGEHEPFAEYLTYMLALFDRMSPPWSLDEQLGYVYRNMLSRYRVAVDREDIPDFATLERRVTRVERSYESAKTYRAPPTAEQSIFPELAYKPPKKEQRTATLAVAAGVETRKGKGKAPGKLRKGTAAAAPAADSAAETSAIAEAASPRGNIKCWNCEKTGHVARECKEAQRVHCYRCGKLNFTVKTCPSCSGNEKGSQ